MILIEVCHIKGAWMFLLFVDRENLHIHDSCNVLGVTELLEVVDDPLTSEIVIRNGVL